MITVGQKQGLKTIIAAVTITLILVPVVTDSVFAVQISSKTGFVHIKGVKVLKVHTVPSKVTSGSTFGLRGIVVNNSTATITFANGTCTSPLSVTFNKNAVSEPQTTTTATCRAQHVTLKPGGQSPILVSNLSGVTYRATSPGTTNATLVFKYGVLSPTSSLPVGDNVSRVYTLNILSSDTASGPQKNVAPPTITSSGVPGLLPGH